MDSRNLAFQKLKPVCVAVSQAALALHGPHGDIRSVTSALEKLEQVLFNIVDDSDSLDFNLAEYCFFPLSQVLKSSQKLSVRCLELSLQCLAILINHGWRSRIQPQLAAQICILCTLMAERKPKGFAFRDTTDELQVAAFKCLRDLFVAAGSSKDVRQALTSEPNVLQFGQTISTVLDSIYDNPSIDIQSISTEALAAATHHVANAELCFGFLPGIVSKLTKVLTPSTRQRRHYRVLIGCLHILTYFIRVTLSDTTDSPQSNAHIKASGKHDAEWRQNTATQLKLALTPILTLKQHPRADVKNAVAELCLMLLHYCRETLSNCSALAIETLVNGATESPSNSHHLVRLEVLLRGDRHLSDLMQNLMYKWLQALPTAMQSADEQQKIEKLRQIGVIYNLLTNSGIHSAMLDKDLTRALRDSIAVTIKTRNALRQSSSETLQQQILEVAPLRNTKGDLEFDISLGLFKVQQDILNSVETVLRQITASGETMRIMDELSRTLRNSDNELQLANFWMLLTCTEFMLQNYHLISTYVEADDSTNSGIEYLEQLGSVALSVLSSSSDISSDYGLHCLALRALALRARTAGPDFRYELIDSLYPVLHALATPNEQLQRAGLTTLNIFTEACIYPTVGDLIVQNVDYLTNAVALKLNSFDLLPQGPQVLLVMVRLTGASLLPYLEDTVDAIFVALEYYHGYPTLLEVLFKVLVAIAEEGVKAPQLCVTNADQVLNSAAWLEKWQPTTIEVLAEQLKERRKKEMTSDQPEIAGHRGHPTRPWRKDDEFTDEAELSETDVRSRALGHQDESMDLDKPPPPIPKTYNLLFKITELTQHFMPSASPSLRASLLTLVRMTVPALAKHENSFLPLVNTLWPEIASRLENEELHVRVAALEVVGVLCEYAGDFMLGRVTKLWPTLVEMYDEITNKTVCSVRMVDNAAFKSDQHEMSLILRATELKQAVCKTQKFPAHYSDTGVRAMRDAIVDALAIIVRQVPLTPDLFDQALEMLEPVLDQETIRSAVEQQNADALWLASIRADIIPSSTDPLVPQGVAWRFAQIVR